MRPHLLDALPSGSPAFIAVIGSLYLALTGPVAAQPGGFPSLPRDPLKVESALRGIAGKTSQAVQPETVGREVSALPTSWRFAHPRADLLAGINMSSLWRSSTFRDLLTQLSASLQLNVHEFDTALASTREVDQLWISMRSGDCLILLKGRLDDGAKLPNGMKSRRISNTATVIGREASVAEALHRLSAPAGTVSAVAGQMNEASAESDIWFTGTRALVAPQAAMAPALADLSSFTVRISLRDGLRLDLILNSPTQAAARRIFAAVQQNARQSGRWNQQGVKLEGTSVRATATIDKADFLANVRTGLSGPAGKYLGGLAAVWSAPNIKPAPAGKGKGTVYGLEGGPKEFEAQPGQPR